MRASDRQHIWKARADNVGFISHTTGNDHAAIFSDSLANRFEALFLCGIEETARVDQNDVGACIIRRQSIAIRTQLGENPFAIDQRLGAAKRYHADLGRCFDYCCHDAGPHSGFRQACHGQCGWPALNNAMPHDKAEQ